MKLVFDKIKEYNDLTKMQVPTEHSILFVGEAIDERSQRILAYLQTFNIGTYEVIYLNKKNSYNCNSQIFKRHELIDFITILFTQKSISSIILECTSLGYTEILTLLDIFNNLNKLLLINIIYTEPKEYRSNKTNLLNDTYELSEDYNDHKYIIPFIFKEAHDTTSSKKATLVTLLGFEENRLGRILEENNHDQKYDEFISIIAIPGFQYGWENISLSKHHHLLQQNKDLFYTPADDPYETYKILTQITKNLHPKKIVIMPIGTKPCAIGTSIFLVNHKKEAIEKNLLDQLATKYDFPIKSQNRTSGIGKIFQYFLKIE